MTRTWSAAESACWPTTEQALLLRAALLPGPESLAAWERWKRSIDLDLLDAASVRLLPHLYRRLEGAGVRDPLMGRLKGTYRHTLYSNHLRLGSAVPVLRELARAGVPTMLLKGAALTVLYYRDVGLRPMDDVDILVPTRQAGVAVDVLNQLGFTPRCRVTGRHVQVGHAVDLGDARGQRIDLHWHLLPESCWPSADATFWEHARQATFHGVEAAVLHPTEQLFHICAHGLKWEPVAPVRWVADAAVVLARAEAEIDWGRLAAQAEGHRMILPLRSALRVLREMLGLPVPAEILERLQRAHVSSADHWEYRMRLGAPSVLLGRICEHWLRYRRRPWGADEQRVGFARYLEVVLGTDGLWDLGRRALLRHRWRRHARRVSQQYARALNRTTMS
ncbi:MAG TPA: nucleotidyltransferase family protein [Candidatus Methylomirabilis sp.]|nr:nucleotidyltransferase family protein [Candidatus Methylomirabilis sp.]